MRTHASIVRQSGNCVQRHCQKTSAPRVTLQKAPSEQSNDSGEEPFSSTEVGKGSSALEWNKVLWSDESKYLMIGTDGVTLVRRPDGSWVIVPTGQRSETLFPLFQGLVRTASSERYDLAKTISRPESLRASLGCSW
uniref:Uncharacterized protein n=1 Tax=Caenorhabditis japonica TaxID=281687 RepID=A0A8R1ED51_CAEJA